MSAPYFLREIADRADRRHQPVHGVDRFEGDHLRPLAVQLAQLGFQIGEVVVAPDALLAAAVADAGDHGGVVLLVGQDHAARQQLLQGGQRGVVGDIGRGEQQRRLLAVQVGKLGLELHVVVRRAGDVAGAAGAGAGRIERRVHGGQHGGVLAHAEVVVGAPYGDRPRAAPCEVPCRGKVAAVAPNVGEHPVAPFVLQSLQRPRERLRVIHEQPHVRSGEVFREQGGSGGRWPANNPAQLYWWDCPAWQTYAASAALIGRDVAGGDLVFVGGESCQDFGLLALRDLGEIKAPSEFRGDLIEFCGGDLEVAVGLLKAKRSLARLGGRELEGPTGNLGDPQRPHEFEAGQPFQVLGVPLPQLRVLGLLANDGVLHDGIAEVIDYRRDGEDAAQPLVQTFLRRGLLGLRVRVIRLGHYCAHRAAVSASPATTLRLVIEVETACADGRSPCCKLRLIGQLPNSIDYDCDWMRGPSQRFPSDRAVQHSDRGNLLINSDISCTNPRGDRMWPLRRKPTAPNVGADDRTRADWACPWRKRSSISARSCAATTGACFAPPEASSGAIGKPRRLCRTPMSERSGALKLSAKRPRSAPG